MIFTGVPRPTYPDQLIAYLSDLCTGHEYAWDCACGSGQASEKIARYFKQVAATDISSQQIDEAPVLNKVDFSVCRAEHTPFADHSFDLITVAQALHWFDLADFWTEVARVIKPGGVFAAFGYNWPDWGSDLAPVIEQSVLRKIEPYFADNNQLLWNDYRDVQFPFTPLTTPQFKITLDYSQDDLFAFLHSASATRRYMDEHGEHFFNQAYAEVSKIWGAPGSRRKLNMDLVLIVGRY